MATTYSSGGQSPTSLSRTVDRVFDDAQHTGEINLSGRKLKEYPKAIASKYDLVDTISADLSKNRLGEVPKEVCEFTLMERLNCYHNIIKNIPDAIMQLQQLTHLNLSRNQLCTIPPFISTLQALEVLIASHNKVVSLPEEIGVLERLMEIDVSCNEISHLPPQVGDLKSLRSLNIRRNLLIELPLEISKLNLRKLDFSGNKISKIPTVFRKMETIEEFVLDNNPLTQPPAHVCTKGKQHIMKYLQIEAIRDERKRGVLNEAEMKRLVRKSLPPQQSLSSEDFRNIAESPENKQWKRHTVLSSDSGYSTTDSIEKCGWSPSEQTTNGDAHFEEVNRLSMRAPDSYGEQRNTREVREMTDQQYPQQPRHRAPASPYASRPPPNPHHESRTHPQDSRPQPHDTRTHTLENRQYSPQDHRQYSPHDARQYSPQDSRQYSPQGSRQSPNDYRQNSRTLHQDHRLPPPPISLNTVPTQTSVSNQHSPALTPKTPTPEMYQYSNVHSPSPKSPSSLSNSSFPTSPQLTPETPTPSEGDAYHDEFTRELQRQKNDYERRKKQAEQLRLRQEEQQRQEDEEKEQRRRAAIRLQEEQRALLERQREEMRNPEDRHREDSRLKEEALHREEMQRMEESRLREEVQLQEEQRLREEARIQEEQKQREEARLKEEQRQKEEAQQYKVETKKLKPRRATIDNMRSFRLNLHKTWHAPDEGYYGNHYEGNMLATYSMHYRKPAPSSTKEDAKETKKSNTHYRRTVSDSTTKKSQSSAPAHNSAPGRSVHVKNGPVSQRTSSSSSVISPSPSPRSSIGSAGPSPASSMTSVNKAGDGKPGSIRRTKVSDRVASSGSTSTTPRTPSGGGIERHGRASTSSTTSTTAQNRSSTKITSTSTNSARKNHLTPEEEFRQKHQSLKAVQNSESQKGKSRVDEPSRLKQTQRDAVNNFVSKRQNSSSFDEEKKRTIPSRSNFSTSLPTKRVGSGVLSSSTLKVIDSYKDADPNFTIRRQMEQQKEELEQLDHLRRTIETKLKVTLPENLSDVLRDGVLLCQLANSIRPRSVTSIHVPSPAVPKLTMAKCRKNVENFLEACRKIGVTRDQICGAQDILEEKGITKVASTISALVAITNPRSSNV